eukprot:g3154.t1
MDYCTTMKTASGNDQGGDAEDDWTNGRGADYFGVQHGKACWCNIGDSYDDYGTSSKCNVNCPGDSSQTCGGAYANDVYGYREFDDWADCTTGDADASNFGGLLGDVYDYLDEAEGYKSDKATAQKNYDDTDADMDDAQKDYDDSQKDYEDAQVDYNTATTNLEAQKSVLTSAESDVDAAKAVYDVESDTDYHTTEEYALYQLDFVCPTNLGSACSVSLPGASGATTLSFALRLLPSTAESDDINRLITLGIDDDFEREFPSDNPWTGVTMKSSNVSWGEGNFQLFEMPSTVNSGSDITVTAPSGATFEVMVMFSSSTGLATSSSELEGWTSGAYSVTMSNGAATVYSKTMSCSSVGARFTTAEGSDSSSSEPCSIKLFTTTSNGSFGVAVKSEANLNLFSTTILNSSGEWEVQPVASSDTRACCLGSDKSLMTAEVMTLGASDLDYFESGSSARDSGNVYTLEVSVHDDLNLSFPGNYYTLFHVARYDPASGSTTERIFVNSNDSSMDGDWFDGFDNGQSGVANHHDDFEVVVQDYHGASESWVLSTSSAFSYRSNFVNRPLKVSKRTSNSLQGVQLAINAHSETASDFQIAEVLVLHTENPLTDEQTEDIERYLFRKHIQLFVRAQFTTDGFHAAVNEGGKSSEWDDQSIHSNHAYFSGSLSLGQDETHPQGGKVVIGDTSSHVDFAHNDNVLPSAAVEVTSLSVSRNTKFTSSDSNIASCLEDTSNAHYETAWNVNMCSGMNGRQTLEITSLSSSSMSICELEAYGHSSKTGIVLSDSSNIAVGRSSTNEYLNDGDTSTCVDLGAGDSMAVYMDPSAVIKRVMVKVADVSYFGSSDGFDIFVDGTRASRVKGKFVLTDLSPTKEYPVFGTQGTEDLYSYSFATGGSDSGDAYIYSVWLESTSAVEICEIEIYAAPSSHAPGGASNPNVALNTGVHTSALSSDSLAAQSMVDGDESTCVLTDGNAYIRVYMPMEGIAPVLVKVKTNTCTSSSDITMYIGDDNGVFETITGTLEPYTPSSSETTLVTESSSGSSSSSTDDCGLNVFTRSTSLDVGATTLTIDPVSSSSTSWKLCEAEVYVSSVTASESDSSSSASSSTLLSNLGGFAFSGTSSIVDGLTDCSNASVFTSPITITLPVGTVVTSVLLHLDSDGSSAAGDVNVSFTSPIDPAATDSISSYSQIACFKDTSSRDLDGQSYSSSTMTPSECSAYCSDFDYFGLQYYSQCFCGNSFGKYGEVSQSECNLPCKGNDAVMCGAAYRNNVYAQPGVSSSVRYLIESDSTSGSTLTFTPDTLSLGDMYHAEQYFVERVGEEYGGLCGVGGPEQGFDSFDNIATYEDSSPCDCEERCFSTSGCTAWLYDRGANSATYKTCFLTDATSLSTLESTSAFGLIGGSTTSSTTSSSSSASYVASNNSARSLEAESSDGSNSFEIAEVAVFDVFLPQSSLAAIQSHVETLYNQLILGSSAELPTITVEAGFKVESDNSSSGNGAAEWGIASAVSWASNSEWFSLVTDTLLSNYGLSELTYGVTSTYVLSDSLTDACITAVSDADSTTHWALDPALTSAHDGDVERASDTYGVDIESLTICRRVSESEYGLREMDDTDICGLASINDENSTCQPTDLHATWQEGAVTFVWSPGCKAAKHYQLIKNRGIQVGADYSKDLSGVTYTDLTQAEQKEELCETLITPGMALADYDTEWVPGQEVEYCLRSLVEYDGDEVASDWTCTSIVIGWAADAEARVAAESGGAILQGVVVDAIVCEADNDDCVERAEKMASDNADSTSWKHALSDASTMLSFTVYSASNSLVPYDESEDRTGACKFAEGDTVDVSSDVPDFAIWLDKSNYASTGEEAALLWYADAPGCFLKAEKAAGSSDLDVTDAGGMQLENGSYLGLGHHVRVERLPSWQYMSKMCRSTCGLTGKDDTGAEKNYSLPMVVDTRSRSFCDEYIDRCPDVSDGSLGDSIDPEELGALIFGADNESLTTILCSPFDNEYGYYDESELQYKCCSGYRPSGWDNCNRRFTECNSDSPVTAATVPTRKFRLSVQTAEAKFDEAQASTSAAWIEYELGADNEDDAEILLVNETIASSGADTSGEDVQIAGAWVGYISEYHTSRTTEKGLASMLLKQYETDSASSFRRVYYKPRTVSLYPSSDGAYIQSTLHAFKLESSLEGANSTIHVELADENATSQVELLDTTINSIKVHVKGVWNDIFDEVLFNDCGTDGILMCAFSSDDGTLLNCGETNYDGEVTLSVPDSVNVIVRNGCPSENVDHVVECGDGIDDSYKNREIVNWSNDSGNDVGDARYNVVTSSQAKAGAEIWFTEVSTRTFGTVVAAGRYDADATLDNDKWINVHTLSLKLRGALTFDFALHSTDEERTEGSCDVNVGVGYFGNENDRWFTLGIPPTLEFGVGLTMADADDYSDAQSFAIGYLDGLPEVVIEHDDDAPEAEFMLRKTATLSVALQHVSASSSNVRTDLDSCTQSDSSILYGVNRFDNGDTTAVEVTVSVKEEYSADDGEVEEDGVLAYVPGTVTTEDNLAFAKSMRFVVSDGYLQSSDSFPEYPSSTIDYCSLPNGCDLKNIESNSCAESTLGDDPCNVGGVTFEGTLYQNILLVLNTPERYEPYTRKFRFQFTPELSDVANDETSQEYLMTEQMEIQVVVEGAIALTKDQAIKLPEYIPFLILRDPPGGGSSATWQKGSSSSVTVTLSDGDAETTTLSRMGAATFEFETEVESGLVLGLPPVETAGIITGTKTGPLGSLDAHFGEVYTTTKARGNNHVVSMTAGMSFSTSSSGSGPLQDVYVTPSLAIRTLTELPISYDSSQCIGVAQSVRSAWEMLDGKSEVGEGLEKYDDAYERVEDGVESVIDVNELSQYAQKAIEDDSWNAVTVHTAQDILRTRIPQLQERCAEEWNSLFCNYDADLSVFTGINTVYAMYDDSTGINMCNITMFTNTYSDDPDQIDCEQIAELGEPGDGSGKSCASYTTECPEGCSGGPSTKYGCQELAEARLEATLQGIIGWKRSLQLNVNLKEASVSVPMASIVSSPLLDLPVDLGPGNGDKLHKKYKKMNSWAYDADKSTLGNYDNVFTSDDGDGTATSHAEDLYMDKIDASKGVDSTASIIAFSGGGTSISYSYSGSNSKTLNLQLNKGITANAGANGKGNFKLFGVGMSLGKSLAFNWGESEGETRVIDGGSSTQVSFTLNDGNVGDFFDVEISRDEVYGTPVFKTVAGRSMCPHEAGTDPREQFDVLFPDENELDLSGSTISNKSRNIVRASGDDYPGDGGCVEFYMDFVNNSPYADKLNFEARLVPPLDTDKYGTYDFDGLTLNIVSTDSSQGIEIDMPVSEPFEERRWLLRLCPEERDLAARHERFAASGLLDEAGNVHSGYLFCNLGLKLSSQCERPMPYWKGVEFDANDDYTMCSSSTDFEKMQKNSDVCYSDILPEIFGTGETGTFLVEEKIDASTLIHCLSFDSETDLCSAEVDPCATS